MKKFLVTTTVLAMTLGLTNVAHADINTDLANICTIVKNNDKAQLRKKIKKIKKDYKIRLPDVYSSISCGSNSLIRHAMKHSANEAGEFLIKQMNKKALREAESDGQTLSQWAEANGHSGSALGAALAARIGG